MKKQTKMSKKEAAIKRVLQKGLHPSATKKGPGRGHVQGLTKQDKYDALHTIRYA
jgi:hypothetical protein